MPTVTTQPPSSMPISSFRTTRPTFRVVLCIQRSILGQATLKLQGTTPQPRLIDLARLVDAGEDITRGTVIDKHLVAPNRP